MTLPILFKVIDPKFEHNILAHLYQVPCDIWQHILHCEAHEEGHSHRNLKNPGIGAFRAHYAEKLPSWKIVSSLKIFKHDPT